LEDDKRGSLKPLKQREGDTKEVLLDAMKKYDLQCVRMRSCTDKDGKCLYLVKKTTTSSRTITNERIVAGIDKLDLDENESISSTRLETLRNDIYNCVRSMCVVQTPTISLTTAPPMAFKEHTNDSMPDVYQNLEKNVHALRECQNVLKSTRAQYGLRQKDLQSQREDTEPLVIRYLNTQPRHKRKLRLTGKTDAAAADSMTLQCRTLITTSHTKHVGLKDFRALLDGTMRELLATNNRPFRWFEMKPILIQRISLGLEEFKLQYVKQKESQRVYLCNVVSG
jgi:hypothetical protein